MKSVLDSLRNALASCCAVVRIAAASLLLLAASSQMAAADIVFDFSGTCTSDCTGTATGVLTLSNSYVYGAAITNSTFISWTYADNNFSVSVVEASGDTIFLNGALNANGSQASDILIEDFTGLFSIFHSDTAGVWGQGFTFVGSGNNGAFTPVAAVPEPSTWAMLLIGFAGLGFMAYRRKSVSSALA